MRKLRLRQNVDVGPGSSDMNIRTAKSFAIRKELVDVTGIDPLLAKQVLSERQIGVKQLALGDQDQRRLARMPVVIPGEVERECCGFKRVLDAVMIQKALDESRIRTVTVKNRRLVAKLQSDISLGTGEAEAIALALDEKAQLPGH